MVRAEDERELARRYEEVFKKEISIIYLNSFFKLPLKFPLKVHVDTKSATSMFECLRKKLTHSPAYPHFLSLLQHALLLHRKFDEYKFYFPSTNWGNLIFFLILSGLWFTSVSLAQVAHVWSHCSAACASEWIGRGCRCCAIGDQCQRNNSIVRRDLKKKNVI